MKTLDDLFNATDEERERLTDQELLSIAFRVAEDWLDKNGYKTLGRQLFDDGSLAIRFLTENAESLCLVSMARYPNEPMQTPIPTSLQQLHDGHLYWLGIGLAHELDAFDPECTEGLPPMRGFGVLSKVYGLVTLGM